MSGILLGLRLPFGVWGDVRRSMHIDLSPRYRNTLSGAWIETGRLLSEAERIEGQKIEQTALTSTTRKRKETGRNNQRICA